MHEFIHNFWRFMITRPGIVLGIILSLIVGYVGWSTYHYFFDTTVPQVSIAGIEHEGFYAGDIRCAVAMSDGYKVGNISVFLDGNVLISHFKINRKQDEHIFTIPTKTLSNGCHELKIEVCDASYQKNTTIETLTFCVDNYPLQAAFIKSDADLKVFQGRTLHLQFQVNKLIQEANVKLFGKTFVCVPEADNSLIYECFIPISCEETPNEYMLSIEIADYVGNTVTLDAKFQVVLFPFKKQQLTIKSEKIKEETDIGLPEQGLEERLEQLAQQSPAKKLWRGSFYAPMDIKSISTEFGTVRTTQHRGRYAHNAVDLIGMPKTVIWAPQEGIIVLKDRFVHSGNTIVIDHGCGILSLYYHLDSFANIEVGQRIKKGHPIGRLGMTGYATGYHLHEERRICNVQVDPMQWIKNDF